MDAIILVVVIIVAALIFIPFIVSTFLRNVEAGTIRMVSWLQGSTVIYRGPGKSREIPLFTTGTTLSSRAINVDLDITDQTADVDDRGVPKPIKVRVLASAIVSVGDSDALIKTAANRFFAKPEEEQLSTLTDLLSSSGRRAVNLLTHDQLFSAKTAPTVVHVEDGTPHEVLEAAEDDDDPLAIIIRKACSRELTDLGLIFNSLNIKVVQSEVADARRRQSAAEAQAEADIVAALQTRRAKEAQLEAERVISDKQRELEQTRVGNDVLIAQAEAKKQDALATQRGSELRATEIAQAEADAQRIRIQTLAQAEADALRITKTAQAQAEGIRQINDAIREGGEAYLRYRQLEMLPQIAPAIASALGQAKLVTIAGGDNGGAPNQTTSHIADVIQTVLAAQLVGRESIGAPMGENGSTAPRSSTP